MGQPAWGFSATAGLVCFLLGANWVVTDQTDPGLVLMIGSLVLFAWALWLSREHG